MVVDLAKIAEGTKRTKKYCGIIDRINSLKTWEEVQKRIDELNDLILDALKERSKYPLWKKEFYAGGNPKKQRLLESRLDTIWWEPFYSKIVEKICDDKTPRPYKGIVAAEQRLEELVYERVMIGIKVAEYKAPRGLPLERKDRENDIINYARECGRCLGLLPNDVDDIFRIIMEKNKLIQRLHNFTNGNGFKEIEKTITMAPDMVARIRRRFEVKKEILGEGYHVVSRKYETEGRPVYEIKLVKG